MKYFVFMCVFATIICSCKNSSEMKSVVSEKQFTATLTNRDTVDVISLSSLCLTVLKNDIDSAMNYIYYIKNDTLIPLSDEKRIFLKNSFLSYPIKKIMLDTLIFNTEVDNIVRYNIVYDNGGSFPITQRFIFNPIKIESAWYLTLKE